MIWPVEQTENDRDDLPEEPLGNNARSSYQEYINN